MKKIIAILILCIMAATVFASCGKPKEPNDTTTDSVTTTGKGDTHDKNGYLLDDLPEDLSYKSNGQPKEVTLLSWENVKQYEWSDNSASGNTIELSFYKRKVTVESRLGVKLNVVLESCVWETREAYVSKVEQAQMSGKGIYDIVSGYTPAMGILAARGFLAPLESGDAATYLNLQKPWWPDNIGTTAKVGDHIYFITGDITATLVQYIQCVFFNAEFYRDFDLGAADELKGRDLYRVVEDGDWTLELLKVLSIGVVGDKIYDGYYGFTLSSEAVTADAFFYSGGFLLTNNNNGILTMSSEITKNRFNEWYEEIQKLYTGEYNDVARNSTSFPDKKAIFHTTQMSAAKTYSDKGLDFGVLPMPKYGAEQTEYVSLPSYYVSLWSIPKDANDVAMSGAILEALGSDAYRSITEVVFHGFFTERYLQTKDNADMFRLIMDTVVFDSGRIFADALNMFGHFRGGVTDEKCPSWSTIYTGRVDGWIANIDKLYGAIG